MIVPNKKYEARPKLCSQDLEKEQQEPVRATETELS